MRRFILTIVAFSVALSCFGQGYNSKGGSHRGYHNPREQQQPAAWSGSGIALGSKVFATNHHVVDGAINLFIYFPESKSKYKAEVVATDEKNDLAIVKVNDPSFSGFPAIKYGFKKTVEDVGVGVFVLGYPLVDTMGEEIKLTTGVVSSRSGFQGNISQYQISAPVQPGNSGGPLFNDKGELIGIVSAKHAGADNVSYGVKMSYLVDLASRSGISIDLDRSSQISSLSLSEKCKAVIPCTVMVLANNERKGRTSSPSTAGFDKKNTAESQEQARFVIKNAYIKGQDYSEYYRDAGAYLILYDKDDAACMAIVMSKKNSQSYGTVTDMDVQHYDETPYSYERDVLKFTWNYQNSYDNNKGEAMCRLDVTYKGNEVLFVYEHVLPNGDISRFSGSLQS